MQFISPLICIKESLSTPMSTVINSIIMSKLSLFDNIIFFIDFVLSKDVVFLDVADWLVERSFCPGSCLTKQRISSKENSKAPNRKDQSLKEPSLPQAFYSKRAGNRKLLWFSVRIPSHSHPHMHTCICAYRHTVSMGTVKPGSQTCHHLKETFLVFFFLQDPVCFFLGCKRNNHTGDKRKTWILINYCCRAEQHGQN